MQSFETFCCYLATAIKNSGLSRAELADRLGVKPATIKSWCVGRRSPTVFRLLELSDILGVDAKELFETPAEPIARSRCEVCNRSFRRDVGYRIHLALRAREDDPHRLLHEREEGREGASPKVPSESGQLVA